MLEWFCFIIIHENFFKLFVCNNQINNILICAKEVLMDLEAESTVSVDTGMSSDIADSCNKLLETQKQINTVEEQLKKLKETETTLSEQTIPNLMQKAGIAMLKLADGSSVEVKPFYSARIPAS